MQDANTEDLPPPETIKQPDTDTQDKQPDTDTQDSKYEQGVVDPAETMYKRKSNVVIVSYESFTAPFEQTAVDVLTQFFSDYNNMRTGVWTYMVDNNVDFIFSLVDKWHYSKCIVTLNTLVDIGPTPELMFLLCHGAEPEEKIPAHLNFGDIGIDQYVWARRPLPGTIDPEYDYASAIYLDQLIGGGTKLVVMVCCAGQYIISDYIAEKGNAIPDIVFFNTDDIYILSGDIFMVLLMNLIDSGGSRTNPEPKPLLHFTLVSILTIFKIVKHCQDDPELFWDFLQSSGCISDYRSDKTKQGLPWPNQRMQSKNHDKVFRVFGRLCCHVLEPEMKQTILKDFKSLTFVMGGKTPTTYRAKESEPPEPVYLDYTSIAPLDIKPELAKDRLALRRAVNEYVTYTQLSMDLNFPPLD